MRKVMLILAVLTLASAVPAFAQAAFTDVPTDHWAYDAVNMLQREGYIIGYPDGTFGGRRAITRYEFAVAIARIIAALDEDVVVTPPDGDDVDLGPYVRRDELPDFDEFVRRDELPTLNVSNFATKAELEQVRRLVDEFRDELAALGVDVDAVRRDVAALDARVTAIEAEQRRVKITGSANLFGIATSHRSGTAIAFDRDERPVDFTNTLGRDISVVKDFDLTVVGRVGSTTTAVATINYGNYLNYLGFVDDYVGGVLGTVAGERPTSREALVLGDEVNTLSDKFFPYYLYIDAGMGNGEFQAGRFPLQFTPYTLKKIDVDTYTSILKTDSGNYPVDGAKLRFNTGGIDLTLYAAKHNTNDYLLRGLAGQPTTGMFDESVVGGGYEPMHVLDGHSVGGLPGLIAQSAGARAVLGIPWSGNLGLTFYQAWSQDLFDAAADYDQARVYGADVNIPFGGNILMAGSWTASETLARDGAAVSDIDNDNEAWDASLGFGFGKLGITAGYKDIGYNFASAGSWDKLGRWTNPTNVKGPYARMSYPLTSSVNFILNGQLLEVQDPSAVTGNTRLTTDDEIKYAEGGIRWGLSRQNSLALGYEWVRYEQDLGGGEATESYLTIGWAHQVGDAGFQIGYQFIEYEGGPAGFAYGPDDYKAGLGVVQFGVTF